MAVSGPAVAPRPDSSLSLRPRRSFTWLGVLAAGVLAFMVFLIASNPEDREGKLKNELWRHLTFSRAIWCACQPAGVPPSADDEQLNYRYFYSDISVNYTDVPPLRWWQRLTRAQPFQGTASINAKSDSFDCDLTFGFTAAIAYREGSVLGHGPRGNSRRTDVTRAYYDITDVRVLKATSRRSVFVGDPDAP